MNRLRTAIFIALSLILIAPTLAAPPLILPHRSTWDADMIDSDVSGMTGEGVYVAVLDTGLTANWRDYFPAERIATELGKGFYEPVHYDPKTGQDIASGFVEETSFIGSTYSTHGTHVVSTIIGYNYYAPSDAAAGVPLNPLYIEGIAPGATIIPVKVLHNYNLGQEGKFVFGTSMAVAAGIDYVTSLKVQHPEWPIVISMSIGSSEPAEIEKTAIDNAIAAGVIVVAAAGNDGLAGMDWPGAYPEVISAGANGWQYEWYKPGFVAPPPSYRLWWLQDNTYGFNDIPEPTTADLVYVSDFSGRENQTRAAPFPWAGPQQLDVLAPGSWVRGPFPGTPGYNHLPWWSEGNPHGRPASGNNYYYVGGTSMATPHVSSVAAMLLEKDPTLVQSEVESILKSTALPIPAGSMVIYDISPAPGFFTMTWGGTEATGAGLIQAKAAVNSVP